MRPISNFFVIGKSLDLALQTISFIGMLYFMKAADWGPFAMFLMAAVQYVSAIFWSIVSRKLPKSKNRKVLQRIFLSLGTLLIIGFLAGDFEVVEYIMWMIVYLLIIIGPMLGVWYFITTAFEIPFYKRVLQRKSFY